MFGEVPDEYYKGSLSNMFMYLEEYTDPSTHQPENSWELYSKDIIAENLKQYRAQQAKINGENDIKQQRIEDEKILQSIYQIYKRNPNENNVIYSHEELKIIEQKLIEAANKTSNELNGCGFLGEDCEYKTLEEASPYLRKNVRNTSLRDTIYPYPLDENNVSFYFPAEEQ